MSDKLTLRGQSADAARRRLARAVFVSSGNEKWDRFISEDQNSVIGNRLSEGIVDVSAGCVKDCAEEFHENGMMVTMRWSLIGLMRNML